MWKLLILAFIVSCATVSPEDIKKAATNYCVEYMEKLGIQLNEQLYFVQVNKCINDEIARRVTDYDY